MQVGKDFWRSPGPTPIWAGPSPSSSPRMDIPLLYRQPTTLLDHLRGKFVFFVSIWDFPHSNLSALPLTMPPWTYSYTIPSRTCRQQWGPLSSEQTLFPQPLLTHLVLQPPTILVALHWTSSSKPTSCGEESQAGRCTPVVVSQVLYGGEESLPLTCWLNSS